MMDQKLTRRRLLGTGAALAVAAPLAALPFPAGIGPAPVVADTTKADLDDDDLDWMAKRVTRNEWGDTVIGTRDRTLHWSRHDTPLHIRPDDPDFYALFEFMRRSRRQQDEWQAHRAVKTRAAWVWSVPEPLRAGLLAVIDDVAKASDALVNSALSNVLYSHIERRAGVNVGDDDDDEYQELSDAQKLAALRAPTTIGAVLLAISGNMQMDPRDWLNEHDLALLEQAAE